MSHSSPHMYSTLYRTSALHSRSSVHKNIDHQYFQIIILPKKSKMFAFAIPNLSRMFIINPFWPLSVLFFSTVCICEYLCGRSTKLHSWPVINHISCQFIGLLAMYEKGSFLDQCSYLYCKPDI